MVAENLDQGFNDSELADIMQEIESLEAQGIESDEIDEKMLEDDGDENAISEDDENEILTSLDAVENTVEEIDKIDAEMEAFDKLEELEDQEELETQAELEVEQEPEPEIQEEKVTMKNPIINKPNNNSSTEHNAGAQSKMHFDIEGQMSMSLGFTISGKTINIVVDADNGLELFLPGGMKFSIPVE